MTKQLKVIIADETAEFGQKCAEILKENGMKVMLCAKDGNKVISAIKQQRADVVIADVFMPGVDILGVLKFLKETEIKDKPMVVAVSCSDNSNVEKKTLEAGASYYFLKPFDFGVMAQRIIQLSNWEKEATPIAKKNKEVTDSQLEIMITEIIHEIGIPANLRGYNYIRYSIMLTVRDETIINSITKTLYPTVAKKHDTTTSRVERSIRHAIRTAWDRGNDQTLKLYFGYTIQNAKERPTNSEFIAMISDKIRLQLKAG